MADFNNMYVCTPRQIRTHVTSILEAGLVPYVRASPGTGKSSIFSQIARDFGLGMIDHRLSTSDPTDQSGLPHFVNGKAMFAPFEELFPIQSTPLPAGKEGWLVFLDEFNACSKQVQAASYKLILDRMTGQHRLNDRVLLAMAGNLDTDRAITNPMSTAMQSRVVNLIMLVNFIEWYEDVALPEGYDFRVKAYLSQFESKLMEFRPDHTDLTFSCPRTWEFVNKLIKGKEVTDDMTAMLAGTITAATAAEFVQYCQIYKDLVTVHQIMADPQHCHVPYETNLKWATVCHMLEKITDKNFDDLSIYANRFDLSFRILFFRTIMAKKETQHLRSHPAFSKAMLELSRYLNG